MVSTASTISVVTEIIAALGDLSQPCLGKRFSLNEPVDLFYDIRMNPAVAMFQIFATQMVGYGFAGIRKCFHSRSHWSRAERSFSFQRAASWSIQPGRCHDVKCH